MELTAPLAVVAIILAVAGFGLFIDTMERSSEFSSNEGGVRAGAAALMIGMAGVALAIGIIH